MNYGTATISTNPCDHKDYWDCQRNCFVRFFGHRVLKSFKIRVCDKCHVVISINEVSK
jgi:hypothetical protein